uniref:G_PROTEIN_RECEP_F1_2 domain-containing protein n=1 Tax=Meloidogyne hapla TaxID=6305 RepID=A0A1I8B6Q6_MELHA
MKKVYRSLFLIVFINIGGYLICIAIAMYIITPYSKTDPLHSQMYNIYNGIILTTACASNAPILFINRIKALIEALGSNFSIGVVFSSPHLLRPNKSTCKHNTLSQRIITITMMVEMEEEQTKEIRD